MNQLQVGLIGDERPRPRKGCAYTLAARVRRAGRRRRLHVCDAAECWMDVRSVCGRRVRAHRYAEAAGGQARAARPDEQYKNRSRRARFIFEIFLQMPYDGLTIGNRDLGYLDTVAHIHDVVAPKWNDPATEFDNANNGGKSLPRYVYRRRLIFFCDGNLYKIVLKPVCFENVGKVLFFLNRALREPVSTSETLFLRGLTYASLFFNRRRRRSGGGGGGSKEAAS
jgi:hypothetical protein